MDDLNEKFGSEEKSQVQISTYELPVQSVLHHCQNCPTRQSESPSAIFQSSKPAPSKLSILFIVAVIIASMKKIFSKGSRKDSGKELDGMPDGEINHVKPTAQDVKAAFGNSIATVGDARKDFERKRSRILGDESANAWDREAVVSASENERKAANIVRIIREDERDNLFGNKATEALPGPETLDMGGQFLTNLERIETKSRVFKIAQEMPKGMHLHLHFNAELDSRKLITKAGELPHNMFIRSTQPLLSDKNYAETELVFNVMPANTPTADCFSPEYQPAWRTPEARPWMRWTDFREELKKRRPKLDAETWIRDKMVLNQEEVYGISQTVNGIWARFNQATRCFKGLLNYESLYRWYVHEAIKNMIKHKVMYAELRPMLMDKTIPSDDGESKLDHNMQMELILDEIRKYQDQLRASNQLHKFPFGLKIIYCTPRSIPKEWMQREIEDCIKLKLQFPDLICGFDLVGAEDRPNHIGYYRDELLAMVQTCKRLQIEIPFMFHAGETLLDTGGSRDPLNSNLYECVLLNAKRIGHGFAMLKHPVLVEQFKKKNICVELCPTSNELLHLCRNVKEHPFPEILAQGIPCTVNADNPSLFSNSVSHEFYQVMVGSPAMSVHGWKQLCHWSIQYSCLSNEQKQEAFTIFARDWEAWCTWVVSTYGQYANDLEVRQ